MAFEDKALQAIITQLEAIRLEIRAAALVDAGAENGALDARNKADAVANEAAALVVDSTWQRRRSSNA